MSATAPGSAAAVAPTAGRRWAPWGQALAAVAVAFALLAAAAVTLAYRGAVRQEAEKLVIEADIVRGHLAAFLAAGPPIKEFSGFDGVARSLKGSDRSIAEILVADRHGKVVFASRDAGLSEGDARLRELVGRALDTRAAALDTSGLGSLAVALPMADRLGTAGAVAIASSRPAALAGTLTRAAVALVILLVILGLCGLHYALVADPEDLREPRGRLALVGTPVLVAAAVLAAMMFLATEAKTTDRARAVADSLAARLAGSVELGIAPEDLAGLDEILADYRTDAATGLVAVLVGNTVVAATEPGRVGKRWAGASWPLRVVDVEVRPRAVIRPQLRVVVGFDGRRTLVRLAGDSWPFAVFSATVLAGILLFCLRPFLRPAASREAAA